MWCECMSKSWMVWILASFTYMLAFVQRTAPGLVTGRLAQDFRVSPAAMGELAVGQFLAYAALQLPVGLLGDRFGPARWLALGAALDGAGTLLFSQAHTFTLLVLSRGVVGLGDAMLWVNIVLLMGGWFAPSVYGRALAGVGTAGGAAAMASTVPLAWILSVAGWRITFIVMGCMLVGMGAAIHLVLPAWERARVQHAVHVIRPATPGSTLRKVVASQRGWIPFTTHFGLMGAYMGFVAIYAIPYLMDTHKLTAVEAGAVESVAMLGSVLGGPIAGWAADRFGPFRPLWVVATVSLMGWITIAAWPLAPLGVTTIALFLIGSAGGGSILTFTLTRAWFPSEAVGSASGLANTGGFIAAALFPLLCGRLLGAGWGVALWPGAVFGGIGWVGAMLANLRAKEWSPAV